MRGSIAAVIIVALLGSQAAADSRTKWRAVFLGALGAGVVSTVVMVTGYRQVQSAQDTLCEHGVGSRACLQTSSDPWFGGRDDAALAATFAKGNRGVELERIGTIGLGASLGVAAAAGYKGYLSPEPKVVVAPVVTEGGGGGTLRLRF